MKGTPRLSLSSKKKREVLARKLSVLDAIDEEKGILFAPFSTSITHADKVRGWQAVLQIAKAVGLVAQNRDWKFIRDKVFSVCKSRTMAKRENSIDAGSECSSVKFDKVDLNILDIIGQDSPIKDKVVEDKEVEAEDKTEERVNQVVPHFAEVATVQSSVASSNAGIRSNIEQNKAISRVNIDEDYYVSQKKKLTLELLKHDVHLRKLQALKLEMEMGLGLKRSEFTQELLSELEVEGVKTENTCEMEFEY